MFESVFSQQGLSLDRLKTLLDVQAAGSIAGAAPDSSSRQSQFSRQLRDLSEYFGSEIVKREGKGIRLTDFGEKVADLAFGKFRAIEDLLAESRASSQQFRIVAGDSVLQWLVAPRLAPVKLGKALAGFSSSNVRTGEAIHRIQEGRADFGIVRKDSVPRGLKSALLGCMRFKAVVPQRISGGKVPTLAQLFDLPLAVMVTDGQFTTRLREIARNAGRQLVPAFACESFPQVLSAVRSGSYAAIVPALGSDSLAGDDMLTVQPDAFRTLERELMLIWNKRVVAVRPGAEEVIEFLCRALAIK